MRLSSFERLGLFPMIKYSKAAPSLADERWRRPTVPNGCCSHGGLRPWLAGLLSDQLPNSKKHSLVRSQGETENGGKEGYIMGCIISAGAKQNEETGAKRIDKSPCGAECGQREAPRPGLFLSKQRAICWNKQAQEKQTKFCH